MHIINDISDKKVYQRYKNAQRKKKMTDQIDLFLRGKNWRGYGIAGWREIWLTDIIKAVDEQCTQRIDKLERSLALNQDMNISFEARIKRIEDNIENLFNRVDNLDSKIGENRND